MESPGTPQIGHDDHRPTAPQDLMIHTATSSVSDALSSPSDSQHTLQGIEIQEPIIVQEVIRERYGNPSSYRFRRVASKTIVSFGPDDPENPVNWRKV